MNREPGTTQDTQLRVHCTADADGRITFRLPALDAPQPQVLLRLRPKKGQTGETVRVLAAEAVHDGTRRAVLEPWPALAEGRWDVHLLPEPGAPRQRLRPALRDVRALVDGHTRDWPSPVAVRVPYTTKDGYLAVRTWLRTAHAEVEGIAVTDGSMTVTARSHGAPLAAGAVVRLRARGTKGAELTREPQVDSGGRRSPWTSPSWSPPEPWATASGTSACSLDPPPEPPPVSAVSSTTWRSARKSSCTPRPPSPVPWCARTTRSTTTSPWR
ncbi:transferase [Streptomyces sp. NPDC002784]